MQLNNSTYQSLKSKIFKFNDFNQIAFEISQFQQQFCEPYQQFTNQLNRHPSNINDITQLSFLPIDFFKRHKVTTINNNSSTIFESSGTTNMTTSKHYVSDISLYKDSYIQQFSNIYGNPEKYTFFGLLPSYLERKNASLVDMVKGLMAASKNNGGFYLNEYGALSSKLKSLKNADTIPFVFGVSFALLDFAEQYSSNYEHCIFLETGGMKGRKKEITREELHGTLAQNLNVNGIHSEYGMTELLSQAYSKQDGIFTPPKWMKVVVRAINDPLNISLSGKGILNIIDFANLGSCSFIATQDLGEVFEDGSFTVLGRVDNSDIRGCSLML